jgi:heme oxygenase (mycobilin-producing)
MRAHRKCTAWGEHVTYRAGAAPVLLATIGTMTVIRINAITVPADSGEEVARRFAARAGSVDGHDGFEGFELLRPTDGRTTWLVVTRWRDEASFDAWVASPAFAQGHQGGSGGPGGGRPMGLSAELWSFEPVVGSSGNQ